ncbi:MAG TPA: histidine kinase, partial [Ktedonobacterales bacterium]|nr:histidine kinase [Ktedonobacterales bacterium]
MSSDYNNTSRLPPGNGFGEPYPDRVASGHLPQRAGSSGPTGADPTWGMPVLPAGPGTDPFATTGNWAPMIPGSGPSGGPGSSGAPSDMLAASAQLLTASKHEYEQIGRELDEIRMLIKQSSSELEKLSQRKILANAKTREMEEKIETFSRQEIRASYLASSEADMRAFMISEQRDQLQAKEKAFDRYQRFLKRAIDVVSSLAETQASWQAPVLPPAPGRSVSGAVETMSPLARVIQAQEEVRQRVAQRLHDGPAQSLANVVLTAEICEKLFQSDPKRAQSELGNLKGQVNSTLQDTRKFIFELRPM